MDIDTDFNDMYIYDGLTAHQKKVLGVVNKNETEVGANILTDFDHLGRKLIFYFTFFLY